MKMKSQIIILDMMILLIVLSVCTLGIYVEAVIFYDISLESSNIMMNVTDIKQIDSLGNQVEAYLIKKHKRSIQLLDNIASFFFYLANHQKQFLVNQDLQLCLTEDDYKNSRYIQNIPQFCYQIHSEQYQQIILNDNIKLLYQGLKQLDQFSLLFNMQWPNFLQVVDTSPIIFDSLYPTGLLLNNYNPQDRIWYQNHMAQANNTKNEFYFFTNVYQVLYGTDKFSFSITQSLFDQQKEFFAIVKTQVYVTDQNLQKIQFNVLLINQDGQVMHYGMENPIRNVEALYIYNETITGFNFTDWKEIEKKANNEQSSQNQYDQIFMLYNKLYQQFVKIKCKKFIKENFTLILFTNLTQQNILEQRILDEQKGFYLQYGYAVLIIFGLAILLFCLSVFFINLICNPIVNLRLKISQHVLEMGNNTDKIMFKMQSCKKNNNDVINKLNEMFMNISDTLKLDSNKKNKQCRLIEKMQYNKRNVQGSCQKLNQQIHSLSDFNLRYVDFNQFNKEVLDLLMNCTYSQL
ncbi:unnamed protein product (macronuclear) [Paramecium tetraurelia]|uniref:Transmembrane protein n=1 Tax=Paramecium tetraurelia TaxID=5888 RepID=A0D3M4_PARTE|nr:uncharacterized protein GSPATT00013129001 [Paramecium tetraurelia]CAK77641.1 unnamed protein product [Paramecium tetraurelia]|eukprot:XP_001445038.1 hypothetical protein (macronuclear) [Paramecium tetraurelia strain d4-2]